MGVKGEEAKGVIARLQDALSQAGVKAKLIYSGGVDLDILPEGASKGKGLEFLLRQVWTPSHGALQNMRSYLRSYSTQLAGSQGKC